MTDYLDNAKEEVKRADHLIFVSLKYTRTVDVLKHVVERLINILDNLFSALLEKLVDADKIEAIPMAPIQRANLLKETYPDDALMIEFCDLFMRLRKIDQARYEKSTEFRRHVTMTAFVTDEDIAHIDIDIVTDYFKKIKDFFEHVEDMMRAE